MKSLTPTEPRSQKKQRQREVLLAFVAYYIQTAKPVASAVLQEMHFPHISSATLRNYFSTLEEEGYLTQQHASAGRVPTDMAYRVYAEEALSTLEKQTAPHRFPHVVDEENREIVLTLQKYGQLLSEITHCAVFLSAPRFDQDIVISIRWVMLTPDHLACLILSDFGQLQTLQLFPKQPLTPSHLEALDAYTRWRLGELSSFDNTDTLITQMAHELYSEAMLRYMARYSYVLEEDIYRTGFSQLLSYQELRDPVTLTQCLGFLENRHALRLALRECRVKQTTHYWIGSDLASYTEQPLCCSVLAAPYFIQKTAVGAVGLLGAARMPYNDCFAALQQCTQALSDQLTRSLYHFKITYRKPSQNPLQLTSQERLLLAHDPSSFAG